MKAFTIDRDEQNLIALCNGFTPYQWASLNDDEQQERLEDVIHRYGAEIIRKALVRLRSLNGRDQMIWFVTLANFQPELFQRFVKNPPGPVPTDVLQKIAYGVFIVAELRAADEARVAQLQKEALELQIHLNEA